MREHLKAFGLHANCTISFPIQNYIKHDYVEQIFHRQTERVETCEMSRSGFNKHCSLTGFNSCQILTSSIRKNVSNSVDLTISASIHIQWHYSIDSHVWMESNVCGMGWWKCYGTCLMGAVKAPFSPFVECCLCSLQNLHKAPAQNVKERKEKFVVAGSINSVFIFMNTFISIVKWEGKRATRPPHGSIKLLIVVRTESDNNKWNGHSCIHECPPKKGIQSEWHVIYMALINI